MQDRLLAAYQQRYSGSVGLSDQWYNHEEFQDALHRGFLALE